jgi:hypothetical protein
MNLQAVVMWAVDAITKHAAAEAIAWVGTILWVHHIRRYFRRDKTKDDCSAGGGI